MPCVVSAAVASLAFACFQIFSADASFYSSLMPK
jgi:hypothetical protein